jgi:hypothetical protein
MNGKGHCMYRNPDGLKCAIGCLIPDEVYTPDMEGTIAGLIIKGYLDISALGEDGEHFLDGLQTIHDFYHPVDWEQELNLFELEMNEEICDGNFG